MAQIFNEEFDSGNKGNWDTETTTTGVVLSYVTDEAVTTNYSMLVQKTGTQSSASGYVEEDLGTDYVAFLDRFYIKIKSWNLPLGGGEFTIYKRQTSTNKNLINVFLERLSVAGERYRFRAKAWDKNDALVLNGPFGANLDLDTWYMIETYYRGDFSNAVIQVRLNREVVASASGVDTTGYKTRIIRLGHQDMDTGDKTEAYYDSYDSYNTQWPGGRIFLKEKYARAVSIVRSIRKTITKLLQRAVSVVRSYESGLARFQTLLVNESFEGPGPTDFQTTTVDAGVSITYPTNSDVDGSYVANIVKSGNESNVTGRFNYNSGGDQKNEWVRLYVKFDELSLPDTNIEIVLYKAQLRNFSDVIHLIVGRPGAGQPIHFKLKGWDKTNMYGSGSPVVDQFYTTESIVTDRWYMLEGYHDGEKRRNHSIQMRINRELVIDYYAGTDQLRKMKPRYCAVGMMDSTSSGTTYNILMDWVEWFVNTNPPAWIGGKIFLYEFYQRLLTIARKFTSSIAGGGITQTFQRAVTVTRTLTSTLSLVRAYSRLITITRSPSFTKALQRIYTRAVAVTRTIATSRTLQRIYSRAVAVTRSFTSNRALQRLYSRAVTITRRFGSIRALMRVYVRTVTVTRKFSSQVTGILTYTFTRAVAVTRTFTKNRLITRVYTRALSITRTFKSSAPGVIVQSFVRAVTATRTFSRNQFITRVFTRAIAVTRTFKSWVPTTVIQSFTRTITITRTFTSTVAGIVGNIWNEIQKGLGPWTEGAQGRGTWTETQANKGEWDES